MADTNSDTPVNHRLIVVLREALSITLWALIAIKFIVFDFDVYIFEEYMPSLRWILNYRFFGLLVLISIVLIGMGKKAFRPFLIYVICYPFILIFWRTPKLFFRNWVLMVALAPAFYDLLRSFRIRFCIMTLAALSALCILLSSNMYLLIPSMMLLGIYLIMHLYRSLRRAYRSSIFEGLSDLVKKFRISIDDGQQTFWKKEKCDPETKEYEQQCLMFYMLNSATEIVEEKLLKVAKSRKPDLYLMISWLGMVLLTSLVYAFEYWSLYKLDTHIFSANYHLSFWSFLGFSFGKLTPSSLSTISPATVTATILSYSELFCALLILVILVFSVLTAAREKYREDIADFVSEVGILGKHVQGLFFQLYEIAIVDVELMLLSSNAVIINQLRKARGLPAFPAPESCEPEKPEDTPITIPTSASNGPTTTR